MMILPIGKKLKKRRHKNIALAQDILIMEVYNSLPKSVIHGDTSIWRCYGSNRFSEDVDVYLPFSARKSLDDFLNNLKGRGFIVEKFKRINNSVFAKFSYLGVMIRFEAIFKSIKNFIPKTFELSDGTSILANTLEPEEMIKEKVSAYKKRKKIRDLYDVFFLLKFVEEKKKVKDVLKRLVEEFVEPVDEKELKTLIISGSVPRLKDMMEVIRKWAG